MKKISKYLLLGFLAIVSVILLYAFLAYPAEYARRALLWGDADVYNYLKFPERPLTESETPFEFSSNLDEERIRARFEAISGAEDFDEFLEKKHTQAFIVIRDDAILYEKYFNGGSRDSIVTSFSTAKSFDSALIGIAIAEGFIHSVEDPIIEYLPELAERDPAFAKITIRDLLMMSSGIRYVEFPFLNGDDVKTYYFPDLRQLALNETRITGSPGEQFHYNNYHPLLLGLILERSTGRSVAQYLQEKIWSQIGMEFNGSWSLDEVGFEKMESGINARAIDFAKFGRLFLRNGDWDGAQVIPAAWVAESTQADTTVDYANYYYDDFIFANGQGFYKYMWWGIQRDSQNYDFMALGNHGQFIYVSPQKNLIILRFGESYGFVNGSQPWVEMFYEFAESLDG
ncbi:MAG: class C beta-lactamase-related serine hydrolase [Anaerolineales bacterium]|nr:MAG: class C beta-lactamase-related serine hydrolase [Anaerolineales bacterium]